MPRVKRGNKRKEYRKKILKRASGYFLTKSKLYQAAEEAVERGLKFAYRGRREKKRQFRSLWIVRIGAAAKLNGMSYSQLIHGLKLAGLSWTARFWPTSPPKIPRDLRLWPPRQRPRSALLPHSASQPVSTSNKALLRECLVAFGRQPADMPAKITINAIRHCEITQ